MRSIVGVVSLLIALALVGLLARTALTVSPPDVGAGAALGAGSGALPASRSDAASTPRQTAEAVRKALDNAAASAQRQRDSAEEH